MHTPFLKNTFFSLALLLSTATVFTACTPEDGNVGPKGTQGQTGPAGAAGDRGNHGALLHKGGFVAGTITGMGSDGVTPLNETFRYEFSGTATPVILRDNGDAYVFSIERTDSLANANTKLVFTTTPNFSSAQFQSGQLRFYRKVSDARYVHLAGSVTIVQFTADSPGTITNFRYDAATGLTTGNYTWTGGGFTGTSGQNYYYGFSTTNRPFQVTGFFSFVARKGAF